MPILCLISVPEGTPKQIKITVKEAAAVALSYEKKQPFTIRGNWVTAGNVAGIFQDKFGKKKENFDIMPESLQIDGPTLSQDVKRAVDKEIRRRWSTMPRKTCGAGS